MNKFYKIKYNKMLKDKEIRIQIKTLYIMSTSDFSINR